MMEAFVVGPIAVTSEHFETVEPDGSHEFGTRIQIRRVRYDIVDGTRHRAGRDAFTTTIGTPIWRADLFGVVGGAPGNHDHAHFHPWFTGMQPCEREFDQAVVDDPIGWTRDQFADLRALLTVGRAEDLLSQVDQAALDAAWPQIEASIRRNFDGPIYEYRLVRELSFTH